jgi:radical SAM protein with 4Fe4S-binding SPASM domain
MDIIRQLGEAGVPSVSLTGGEPLVRDDFLELVDAFIGQGIHIAEIHTNGLLVNEALLDELAKRGVCPEFALSFDGVGWHDWMRGMEGAEKIVIDAIRLLRDRDFPVSAESTFHRNSIASIYETMMLLAGLGVLYWEINPTLNSGNWMNEDDSLNLSIKELGEAYLALVARYFEAGSPITIMIRRFFLCEKGSKEYVMPCKKCGDESDPLCLSVRNTMYIAADGKLLPCITLSGLPIQEEMPSLNDMTVAQALSDSLYLERIETPVSALIEHNPECASCGHRKECGGGCRAAALAMNADNDYLRRDPATCFIFKAGCEGMIRRVAERYV